MLNYFHSSPHVDLCRVFRGAQQHIRRSVPQSYHFIWVGLCGDGFGPSQTCSTHQSRKKILNQNTAIPSSRSVSMCIHIIKLFYSKSMYSRMACTKVCQLELPFLIDEEVLWLQVPVQNLTSVAVRKSSQYLEEEYLKPKHNVLMKIHYLI